MNKRTKICRAGEVDFQTFAVATAPWLVSFTFLESRHSSLLSGDLRTLVARVLLVCVGAAVSFILGPLVTLSIDEGAPVRRGLLAAGLSLPAGALVALANFVVFNRISAGPAAAVTTISQDMFHFTWIFLTWAALFTAALGARQLQEERRRAVLAEGEAHRTQLFALRLQIQPHFLFNTLNTVSGLIELGRNCEAEALIADLAAFLRRSLTTPSEQFVPLIEEVELHVMYLSIERARFCDRLELDCSLAEECAQALVPNLILQPLVENAVKHGLGTSETPVTIRIGAAREGDRIDVWVENSFTTAPLHGGLGIGLRNVRERLEVIFGETAWLRAGQTGAGWTSRISLPLLRASAS
jgi:hypothetical protein